jgi:hypothetical protein
MDNPPAHEADAARAQRFFVDMMITLTEDRIAGAEAVEMLRPLWADPEATKGGGEHRLKIGADAMLTAWARIAEAMAQLLADERRESGRTDSSVTDVWRQLQIAMDPTDDADPAAPGDGPRSQSSGA